MFVPTPAITVIWGTLFGLWVSGMVLIAFYYIWNSLKLERLCKDWFPCDRDTEACFLDICRELQIRPGKVRLGQCYQVLTPLLKGIFRPMILLPVDDYDETACRVILLHELIHYKQRDHWTRILANAATVVQFFNPFAWMLFHAIKRQGEYACDEKACGYVGNEKLYFGVILDLAERIGIQRNTAALQVVEKKSELAERIIHIRNYAAGKAALKRMSLPVCGAVILVSSLPVFAAAGSAAKGYEKLYFATLEETEEYYMDEELVEYSDNGYAEGVEVERGETIPVLNEETDIHLNIQGNGAKESDAFYFKSRTYFTVYVNFSPPDQMMKMGIINEGGARRYVSGKGHLWYCFIIDEPGNYRVFIENPNPTSVEAEESVYY